MNGITRWTIALPALGASLLGAADDGWDQAELERRAAEITAQVEELRGRSFQRPVGVHFASPDDFRAYMERMEEELLSEEHSDGSVHLSKALGLIPADLDVDAVAERMLEGMVGGFYDPFSKAFYLAEATQADLAPSILAHELTHALDDQHYGLNAGLFERIDSSDRLFAYKAVVEGSGLNLQMAWMREYDDGLDLAAMGAETERSLAALEGVPAALWMPLVWSYTGGADFLVRGTGGRGQFELAPDADVDRAFRAPPESTEQVLHPEKYWDPESRDDPHAVAFEVGELPRGWSVRFEDTLGEVGLALLTMPLEDREPIDSVVELARPIGNEFAAGWGGDRAILFTHEGGASIVHLTTVWDSVRDAGEFYACLSMLEDHLLENAAGLWPDEERRRSARMSLEYGPGETGVQLTIRIGASASQERKVLRALTVRT